MGKKVLIPVHKNYGATYFRLETPVKYFDDEFKADFYKFVIDKFGEFPFRSGQKFVDKITGTGWDYLKWLEVLFFTMREKNYDAIWLSRSMLNFQSKLDCKLNNVIYDFDDAVWLGEAVYCFEYYCKTAKLILAGNSFLADRASSFSKKIEIVPTSVDVNVYKRVSVSKPATFTVGWLGSSSGFKYLKSIEKELSFFFESHSNTRLLIIADRFPEELFILKRHIDFISWRLENDVADIAKMDVGIMPLQDGDWEKGKCSFKMLQYMACEIPVIVSAVGMNNEVIGHQTTYGNFGERVEKLGDWPDVLDQYYKLSLHSLLQKGKNGREVVIRHYSTEKISSQIMFYFNKYLTD